MHATVIGGDAAIEYLNALERRVNDLAPAMQEVATRIEGFALARVPRRSGELADSVYARPHSRGVEYGATAPYAGVIQNRTPFIPTDGDAEIAADLAGVIDTYVRGD